MNTSFSSYSDIAYIQKGIDDLEKITEIDRPYTRLVFSDEFYKGRDWLTMQFQKLDLETLIDEAGNLIGYFKSKSEVDKLIVIGSHIDTVPAGGRFDGVAGIISALNTIKYFKDNHIELPFNIAIYDYLGEELNDWGISCLGSRGLVGLLNEEIFSRKDSLGRVLGDEIQKAGGNIKLLKGKLPITRNILACLELHIEQGKILESEKIDIGVVRSIPSISRHLVEIICQAGHSGTVLMEQRADALVEASRLIIYINELALKISGESNQHFVSTVGKINVYPNSASIIPGNTDFTIDLRAVSSSLRDKFLKKINRKIETLNEHKHFKAIMKNISYAPFVEMDKKLTNSLLKSCKDLGISNRVMDSGAGHDTAQLASLVPAAMIFIPCENGLSHCPQEFAETTDIAKGTAVITKTILDLAQKNN